jgi:transposase
MACLECLKKAERIKELEAKLEIAKSQLADLQHRTQIGFFGSSTPSSKVPVKASSKDASKKGGARLKHKGHGRRHTHDAEPSKRESIPVTEEFCPDCARELSKHGSKERTVLDATPMQLNTVHYDLEQKRCRRCKKVLTAKAPMIIPKALFSNQLLSVVATQHYFYGVTMGQLAKQMQIGIGSLFSAMHDLAQMLESVPSILIANYRLAPVKHADETGWRTDGKNGYAWIFSSAQSIIFQLRDSRSAAIPNEVFGTLPLPGVLVVDRYAGYNKVPCLIQYCYAHLLRDVTDLEIKFPDSGEVKNFISLFAPLLAQAMGLRAKIPHKDTFLIEANNLKNEIIEVANRPFLAPSINKMQQLFIDKSSRLFHWADNPIVPADNNQGERDGRRLVIARKISFGSQSIQGAHTREVLMTVLFSLERNCANVAKAFLTAINQITSGSILSPFELLFAAKPP